MNLSTIMNSIGRMKAYKEKLIRSLSETEVSVEDAALSFGFMHPSYQFIIIDVNKVMTSLYDDELLPKDPLLYDKLCSALLMNDLSVDTFYYDEIQYSNIKNFFEGSTPDDILAFSMILITEFIASKFDESDKQMAIIINPYVSDINYYKIYNIKEMIKNYIDDSDNRITYPVVSMLMTSEDTDIILDNLAEIKDLLTVFKKDNAIMNDKSIANLALEDAQGISEGEVSYYNGKILKTDEFKNSDSPFCKFLYHITRGTLEINSTENIKAIFESLKDMIGSIPANTITEWFRIFVNSNRDASNIVIYYLIRLAEKNNNSIQDGVRKTSVTFDYDGTNLFTIHKAKAD